MCRRPLLVGDRLYFTLANNPLLSIVDIKTGETMLDRERLHEREQLLCVADRGGGPHLSRRSRRHNPRLRQSDKLEVLATNRLDDPIDASPVAVGRQLFLRGEKYLYCIEGK